MAPGTECGSNINREKGMDCDDWTRAGRGNSTLVMVQPWAGHRRGSSTQPPLVSKPNSHVEHLALGARPKQSQPEPEELRDVENDWGGVWVG